MVGKKLTEEELNALIAHAHRRVYQLQKELAEQQAMEQKRLAAAMEVQKEEDEGVTKSKVMLELERQAADLAVLYQKKVSLGEVPDSSGCHGIVCRHKPLPVVMYNRVAELWD